MIPSHLRARPSPSPSMRPVSPIPPFSAPPTKMYQDRPKLRPIITSPCRRAFYQRPRILLPLLFATSIIYLAYTHYRVNDLLFLAKAKLRDRSYEEGWFGGCGMRKKPLIYIRGETEVAIVWEMTCETDLELAFGRPLVRHSHLPSKSGLKRTINRLISRRRKPVPKVTNWESVEVHVTTTVPNDPTRTHIVYTAYLTSLEPGYSYTYSIYHSSQSPTKPLTIHTFPFQTPNTSNKLTIAALSDNQYNLRVFHRLLLLLYSFSVTPTLPSLILHAGDVVQNPHSLPQWQTDFFEPLSSAYGVGQTTPILLARGNHDWDHTGQNIYTGGSQNRTEWIKHLSSPRHKRLASRGNHPGTFFATSLHERLRVVVLDSNLIDGKDLEEQEEWLRWEFAGEAWRKASVRIVVVHVPPFLEFWDHRAWVHGGERDWSTFVRHRLTPLIASAGATLVISGHQHAYSRGFLPLSHHPSYTTAHNSSTVFPPLNHTPEEEKGTIYTIIGGAGGTLDKDEVESWPFYEKSIKEQYHLILIDVEFGDKAESIPLGRIGVGRKKGERVYRFRRECEEEVEEKMVDRLSWKAVGVDGNVLDKFEVEAEGCMEWNAE